MNNSVMNINIALHYNAIKRVHKLEKRKEKLKLEKKQDDIKLAKDCLRVLKLLNK